MAKQSAIVIEACNELIKKVRFERAGFTLGDHWLSEIDRDTAAIKAATKNYMESWVVPLLEAIRDGDTKMLREYLR